MEKADDDKYFIIKNRIEKCISALQNAKERKDYEATHISYGQHIVVAAMRCILKPEREQLKIPAEYPEFPVNMMFSEGHHALSPINCYTLLNGRKEPRNIIDAFSTLELLIMHSSCVEPERIDKIIDLFKSARAVLDDPKTLY